MYAHCMCACVCASACVFRACSSCCRAAPVFARPLLCRPLCCRLRTRTQSSSNATSPCATVMTTTCTQTQHSKRTSSQERQRLTNNQNQRTSGRRVRQTNNADKIRIAWHIIVPRVQLWLAGWMAGCLIRRSIRLLTARCLCLCVPPRWGGEQSVAWLVVSLCCCPPHRAARFT